MKPDDILTLVKYNQWANGRILRRAAHLSPEQLTAPCWLSQKNLWQTLTQTVTYRWSQARPRTKPLWHILVHIVNHGTHHRSEIGQYMGSIGCYPGDMDFMMFVTKTTAE